MGLRRNRSCFWNSLRQFWPDLSIKMSNKTNGLYTQQQQKIPKSTGKLYQHTHTAVFSWCYINVTMFLIQLFWGTVTAAGDQHITMVPSLVHRLGYLATVRPSIATSLLPIQNCYISKQEPLLLLIFSFLMSNSTSSSAYNLISHTCVMIWSLPVNHDYIIKPP